MEEEKEQELEEGEEHWEMLLSDRAALINTEQLWVTCITRSNKSEFKHGWRGSQATPK